MSSINKLLSISSPPLGAGRPKLDGDSKRIKEIESILEQKDGFFSFESAFHFFPATKRPKEDLGDLKDWNRVGLWRYKYGDLVESLFFFAEDIFGVQFCVNSSDETICTFDPETAEIEALADDLEGFFDALLEDYDVLAGANIAHQWQATHGALPPGNRLVPIVPFCVGGEFEIKNLQSLRAEIGMLLRADIYNRIRDLPDGAQVELRITP